MELNEARAIAWRAFDKQLEDDNDAVVVEVLRLIGVDSDNAHKMALALQTGHPSERTLAATTFRYLYEATQAPRIIAELLRSLETESDPSTLTALIFALGWTKEPTVLPRILEFQENPDDTVRFAICDVISMCSGGEFQTVKPALLRFSHDEDHDVRWTAVFELGAWSGQVEDSDLRSALERIAATETDSEILTIASQALRNLEEYKAPRNPITKATQEYGRTAK